MWDTDTFITEPSLTTYLILWSVNLPILDQFIMPTFMATSSAVAPTSSPEVFHFFRGHHLSGAVHAGNGNGLLGVAGMIRNSYEMDHSYNDSS